RHGADWRCDGRRVRTPFEPMPADAGALRERLMASARNVT
ncbi:pyridoxamine 5'-phosphate oxidase, partial [Burkholderia territorii]